MFCSKTIFFKNLKQIFRTAELYNYLPNGYTFLMVILNPKRQADLGTQPVSHGVLYSSLSPGTMKKLTTLSYHKGLMKLVVVDLC